MDAPTNETNIDRSDCGKPRDRYDSSSQPVLTKEDWIQLYTGRILRAWFHQEAPLGLALTYADWIRKDLSECYGTPLMRAFIEETYRVTINRTM